jgi:hypothetical protein
MLNFFETIKSRNETLYYFGLICLLFAIFCLIMTKISVTQVYNVNAWYKPFKFAISTTFYAWAMAWYLHYLPDYNPNWFNWSTIVLLGFEIVYIALKASQGQLSHYNISTPLHSFLFSMMALAASLVTIYTAYIGILFFQNNVAPLPAHYLWSIRMGIFIFVIFAFEGFVMGGRMSHTIGGPDGETGLPIVNWSTKYGDPRIAHFIGMHALQVLPILSFYLLKSTKMTLITGIFYLFLAVYTLMQALQGKVVKVWLILG